MATTDYRAWNILLVVCSNSLSYTDKR